MQSYVILVGWRLRGCLPWQGHPQKEVSELCTLDLTWIDLQNENAVCWRQTANYEVIPSRHTPLTFSVRSCWPLKIPASTGLTSSHGLRSVHCSLRCGIIVLYICTLSMWIYNTSVLLCYTSSTADLMMLNCFRCKNSVLCFAFCQRFDGFFNHF